MTCEERTPREEAIIKQIIDMLDDEIGRNFVQSAVTVWSANLIKHEKKLTSNRYSKEYLALAHLISAWNN